MNREQQLIDLGFTKGKDGWYDLHTPATYSSGGLYSINNETITKDYYSDEEWAIRIEEIRNDVNKMKLLSPAEILTKALQEDEDYRRTWKDNIAMAFKDEYWRTNLWFAPTRNEIHEIANNAADNFLNILCNDNSN